jgi:hypothetical protein
MTVRFETSMVRPRSDVVRRDIRLSGVHPMAVGSDVRVGRFGWVSYILWIAVCYQGIHKPTNILRTLGTKLNLHLLFSIFKGYVLDF